VGPEGHPGLITRHEAAAMLGFTPTSFQQWRLRCRTNVRRWEQEVPGDRQHGFRTALFAIEDIEALREEIRLERAGGLPYNGPKDAPLPPEGSVVPVGYPGLVTKKEALEMLGIANRTFAEWPHRITGKLRRWRQAAGTNCKPALYAVADIEAMRGEIAALSAPYDGPNDAPLPPEGTAVPPGYPGLVSQEQAAAMFGIGYQQWTRWGGHGRKKLREWRERSGVNNMPTLFAREDLEKMRAELDEYFGPYTGPTDAPLPPMGGHGVTGVQVGYPGLATREQAAEIIGVPFTTWKWWEREGTVPRRRWWQRARRCRGAVLYAVEDLIAMREELARREQPSPDPERPGVWRVPIRSHVRDMVALIDERDLPVVRGKAWNFSPDSEGHLGEVILSGPWGGPRIPLKRLIFGLEGRAIRVTHANRDPLDCRRANLLLLTADEQAQHNRKMGIVSGREYTSRYKGVCWNEERGKWLAQINKGGVHRYLGRFDSEELAARAYDKAAREIFGEHAHLNFPDGGAAASPVRIAPAHRDPFATRPIAA
jgi:hypothetical protein